MMNKKEFDEYLTALGVHIEVNNSTGYCIVTLAAKRGIMVKLRPNNRIDVLTGEKISVYEKRLSVKESDYVLGKSGSLT